MKIKQPCKSAGTGSACLEKGRPSSGRPHFYRHSLVSLRSGMYRSRVTVNPVADLGRSINSRRTGATKTIAGAFFVPAVTLYGGCARDIHPRGGCAGFLESRSANPRTVVSIPRLAASGDDSSIPGVVPMQDTRNPSALRDRAAAHRAMALAALRADSSLSVRLRRYNHHMTVARSLDADAAQQQITTTSDHLRHARPLAALEAQGGAQ